MSYGAADKEGQIVGTRGWTRGSVQWTRVFIGKECDITGSLIRCLGYSVYSERGR